MESLTNHHEEEREGHARKGAIMLLVVLILWVVAIALYILGAYRNIVFFDNVTVLIVAAILATIVSFILSCGFFTLQPNEARVMVLFGTYKGTIKKTGFYWANPFYSRALQTVVSTNAKKSDDAPDVKSVKAKLSLRQRTLNGPKLKVNDKNGNPIEIANVIVWHVVDTAKAVFDVDNYEQYVRTQSETALRHVASLYAYDNNEDIADVSAPTEQITLRSNILEVSQALRDELSERLAPAGISVEDARLTHLAYAPEIAQVMLRRQQAEAIISARTKIVQGAVSMVDMALDELEKGGVVNLDDERKAAMVSNLMVVLCADNDAQPVINAGTLYN